MAAKEGPLATLQANWRLLAAAGAAVAVGVGLYLLTTRGSGSSDAARDPTEVVKPAPAAVSAVAETPRARPAEAKAESSKAAGGKAIPTSKREAVISILKVMAEKMTELKTARDAMAERLQSSGKSEAEATGIADEWLQEQVMEMDAELQHKFGISESEFLAAQETLAEDSEVMELNKRIQSLMVDSAALERLVAAVPEDLDEDTFVEMLEKHFQVLEKGMAGLQQKAMRDTKGRSPQERMQYLHLLLSREFAQIQAHSIEVTGLSRDAFHGALSKFQESEPVLMVLLGAKQRMDAIMGALVGGKGGGM